MSARSEVVRLLTAILPEDVQVLAYARDMDAPAKSTVMLRLDEVRPASSGSGLLNHDFALLLVAKQSASGAADDELDALLADVLHAITRPGNGIAWSKATRATFNEQFPAFEVSITVTIAKE